MAVSKMTYNDNKGFWIAESFMQLAYHYINEELVKSQYILTDKDQLLKEIRFHINGYSVGSMSLGWGGFVESSLEIQTMVQVLENVKKTLNNKGTYISLSELQSIPSQDTDLKISLNSPFPVSQLVKIMDALIQMLKGLWTSTNYNMEIDYF